MIRDRDSRFPGEVLTNRVTTPYTYVEAYNYAKIHLSKKFAIMTFFIFFEYFG